MLYCDHATCINNKSQFPVVVSTSVTTTAASTASSVTTITATVLDTHTYVTAILALTSFVTGYTKIGSIGKYCIYLTVLYVFIYL